jgi:hypothetical protein
MHEQTSDRPVGENQLLETALMFWRAFWVDCLLSGDLDLTRGPEKITTDRIFDFVQP